MTEELARRQSAAEIVRGWEEANQIIESAYKDLDRAQKILNATFGPSAYMYTIPHHNQTVEKMRDNSRRAWRQIINILEVKKAMSLKRIEELDKNIESGEMPPLTIENIQQIAEGLLGSVGEFAHEAVLEVFNFLRPGALDSNRHKTNQKNARFDLGKKVIIIRGLDEYCFGNYKVSHWHTERVSAVDKIFHLADGKPFQGNAYVSPLVDAINTTSKQVGTGQTEYFKFTCHKNCNLHIEFLRPDLVTKLNRVAGNETQLKGK